MIRKSKVPSPTNPALKALFSFCSSFLFLLRLSLLLLSSFSSHHHDTRTHARVAVCR